MMQRPGKMKPATLRDPSDQISLVSLIRFLDKAEKELRDSGEQESADRFEIFRQYLLEDFRGSYLEYKHRAIGL